MERHEIQQAISEASTRLLRNWPLYAFVTSNPLAGYEELPFEGAVRKARELMGINGYPRTRIFEQAWQEGAIDPDLLQEMLSGHEARLTAEEALDRMRRHEHEEPSVNPLGVVDRHLIKWLSVFLDQGSTEWGMPGREDGFYRAWRALVRYDNTLPQPVAAKTLATDPLTLLTELLEGYSDQDLQSLVERHLSALPGWAGYIKYREEYKEDWQQAYPVTMADYLAVRLSICHLLDEPLMPETAGRPTHEKSEADHLKEIWLKAMERSYQRKLLDQLHAADDSLQDDTRDRPEAQMVFCIDTRSERIRRAVEQSGPIETFGYAGFFGVAMDYIHPEKNIRHKACPPIVEAQYEVSEKVRRDGVERARRFDRYNTLHKAVKRFRFTLKNNIPASFGYVESAGLFYGIALLAKTVVPDSLYTLGRKVMNLVGEPESFSEPLLACKNHEDEAPEQTLRGVPLEEQAGIALNAFKLMGWDHFAPLVIFAGHGSHTSNNPFGSSLDCGACAGNRGRHNARVLARICNKPEVRNILSEEHGVDIPEGTLFLAAEHNTTTNHIHLFDHNIPPEYRARVKALKQQLQSARHRANHEQFEGARTSPDATDKEARRRAYDWAETRPEWGLAGNASFIIAPRRLTTGLNLEARSFLHSYDWEKDPDGSSLEAILQGPMVVTQWINNHYYFASVDNDVFGAGTKTTHNVTGNFGVVQGNGGDLRAGLPVESIQRDDHLMQHLPLRLTVIIHAPLDRVEKVLDRNPALYSLINNEWIYLGVMDPNQEGEIFFIGSEIKEAVA